MNIYYVHVYWKLEGSRSEVRRRCIVIADDDLDAVEMTRPSFTWLSQSGLHGLLDRKLYVSDRPALDLLGKAVEGQKARAFDIV